MDLHSVIRVTDFRGHGEPRLTRVVRFVRLRNVMRRIGLASDRVVAGVEPRSKCELLERFEQY